MARRDSGRKNAKVGKSLRASEKRVAKGSSKVSAKGEWPLKRATLFKPERLKYVRKQISFDGCVFCDALKRRKAGEKRESLVLYDDGLIMVIMNKYPYNTGHLLVLPHRHEGALQELSHEEAAGVMLMVQKCVTILQDEYKPAGFNVGLNLGASAGAGIPDHLHSHVIPRWNGDTNFFPLIAQTKVVVETLEQTFDRLIPYFE